MTDRLKIFLAYHKNTPSYKSEVFQPVYAGAQSGKETIDFALPDNTGDNISALNPYYCELTMHYWVLKNYLKTAKEDYIGFGHYRRLPDIPNITDKDYPSIFGCTYSESLKLFETWKSLDLAEYCTPYDIILPCSVYLYANTVNPVLRENEPHYNMYDQFKIEHDNDLLDTLSSVIEQEFPDYAEALKSTFKQDKIHCFNMYIMKRDILKSFLDWEFELLDRTGKALGGWEQEKYLRMAGFLGERLINVWLQKNNNYKIGYFPALMIDFDADYIKEANRLHSLGDYSKEAEILKEYLPHASDKFGVSTTIMQLYGLLNKQEEVKKYLKTSADCAKTAEDYYNLAQISAKYKDKNETIELYKKALELNADEKFYAQSFLAYAKALKDIDTIGLAWNYMRKFNLNKEEQSDYEHYLKIKDMLGE